MERKEIEKVLKTGKKIGGSDWWGKWLKIGSEGELVVMIPKKAVKLAVRRNRIRRKIKEVLRLKLIEKKLKVVVYIKKDNEKVGDEIVNFL